MEDIEFLGQFEAVWERRGNALVQMAERLGLTRSEMFLYALFEVSSFRGLVEKERLELAEQYAGRMDKVFDYIESEMDENEEWKG